MSHMYCPCCNHTKHKILGSKNNYDLFECQSCSLIFVDPMPTVEELDSFYQNYHKTSQYTNKIESKQRRAKKRIKSILKYHKKGRSFVDIGCNAGFAVEAARILGLDATGIDIDNSAIEKARAFFPSAKFQAISIQELAETGQTFDFIYCSEVIEHLLEINSFIESLFKILSSNGVLFITTPDISHYSHFKDLLEWDAVRPPEHLTYFSRTSLRELFKKHGFRKIKFKFHFKPTLKVIIKK